MLDCSDHNREAEVQTVTVDEIVAHYGSVRNATRELGLAPNAVAMWILRGHVPALAQIRIERLTGGCLRYDPDALPLRLRAIAPPPTRRA